MNAAKFASMPRPRVHRPEQVKRIEAEQDAARIMRVDPLKVIERVLLDTSRAKDDRINYALQIAREAMKGEKP